MSWFVIYIQSKIYLVWGLKSYIQFSLNPADYVYFDGQFSFKVLTLDPFRPDQYGIFLYCHKYEILQLTHCRYFGNLCHACLFTLFIAQETYNGHNLDPWSVDYPIREIIKFCHKSLLPPYFG